MKDIKYNIIKKIGVLSENNSKYTKEFNIVSWDNGPANYDIRRWDSASGTPQKGISLSKEEFNNLVQMINSGSNVLDDLFQCLKDYKYLYDIQRSGNSVKAKFDYEFLEDSMIDSYLTITSLDNGYCSFYYGIILNIENSDLLKVYELTNLINNESNIINCGIRAHYELLEEPNGVLVIHCMMQSASAYYVKQELYHLENIMDCYQDEIKELIIPCQNEDKSDLHEINFEDFVVKTHAFYCFHDDHPVFEIYAQIKILTHSKDVITKIIEAGYCSECNTYFILNNIFDEIINCGNPLCQLIYEEVYNRVGISKYSLLKDQSILNLFGYNVSSKDNLSSIERQNILNNILNHKILSPLEISSHINWCIKGRQDEAKYYNAIVKWKEDLEYLKRYWKDSNQRVGVNSITKRT